MVTTLTFIEGQQETREYLVAYSAEMKGSRFEQFLEFLEKQERLKLVAFDSETEHMGSESGVLFLQSIDGEKTLHFRYQGDRPQSAEAYEYLK